MNGLGQTRPRGGQLFDPRAEFATA